jgi:hypothetical protein
MEVFMVNVALVVATLTLNVLKNCGKVLMSLIGYGIVNRSTIGAEDD